VLGHDQVAADVLQDELDQEEELLVEDLPVDHEVSVVLGDQLLDPIWNHSFHFAVVVLKHLGLLLFV